MSEIPVDPARIDAFGFEMAHGAGQWMQYRGAFLEGLEEALDTSEEAAEAIAPLEPWFASYDLKYAHELSIHDQISEELEALNPLYYELMSGLEKGRALLAKTGKEFANPLTFETRGAIGMALEKFDPLLKSAIYDDRNGVHIANAFSTQKDESLKVVAALKDEAPNKYISVRVFDYDALEAREDSDGETSTPQPKVIFNATQNPQALVAELGVEGNARVINTPNMLGLARIATNCLF